MALFTLDIAITVLLAGWAAWLSIAVWNNSVDRGTNEFLIGTMLSMRLIKEDPKVGLGLEARASDDTSTAKRLLTGIICIQVIISGLLWAAAICFAYSLLGGDRFLAVGVTNLALTAFGALWLFFLCGGLWHGYWIKTPQVQQVHLTLVMITVLLLAVTNLPVGQ